MRLVSFDTTALWAMPKHRGTEWAQKKKEKMSALKETLDIHLFGKYLLNPYYVL